MRGSASVMTARERQRVFARAVQWSSVASFDLFEDFCRWLRADEINRRFGWRRVAWTGGRG